MSGITRSGTRQIFLQQSLDGLSVGDAFGERFFGPVDEARRQILTRQIPPAPWTFTDDTAMALSIVEVLKERGEIDQDILARAFARRYVKDPSRGYGSGAHKILSDIASGRHWKGPSSEAFGGTGSMGNGGAMRAAPIGAYFWDDPDRVVPEAAKSARVTHWHPEGQAGAIAVALAASWAARTRAETTTRSIFNYILNRLEPGEVRTGIERARDIDPEQTPEQAGAILGTGEKVLAQDTVPFCIWIAARHPDNYEAALWATLEGMGDRDTTCAIVGSIVALSTTERGIPEAWLAARESLDAQ